MSIPALRRPRRQSAARHSQPANGRARHARLIAGAAIGAALAALPATAGAAPTTGSINVTPTGLGVVDVFWDLHISGATAEVLDGDRLVYREVAPQPVRAGDISDTIPDRELYGSTPITYTVRILDDAGTVLAVSPVATVGPCPARPPRAAAPTNLAVDAFGSSFARIHWTPRAQDLCHAVTTGYAVTAGGVTKTVDANAKATTIDSLKPATRYDISVAALPTSTVQPETPATATVTTSAGTDTTPPSKPGPLTFSKVLASNSATVHTATWGASTDDVGVFAYDLYSGDTLVRTVDGTATQASIQLPLLRSIPLSVVARDADGNTSPPSGPIEVDGCPLFGPPSIVSQATGVAASAVTGTTATITWTPGASNVCFQQPPRSYTVVRDDGTELGTTAATSGPGHLALTGLAPHTEYTVYVRSDGSSGPSTRSDSVSFTTPAVDPVTQPLAYAAKGTATIKNLVRGTLPLTGTASGTLNVATGALTADLALDPTTANLVAYGFLPVTATVKLVPTTQLTGTLTATSLTASTKMRVKLPSIKLFGLTIGGGANCQTTQASPITFASSGAFTATGGGTIAGSLAISSLTGCGGLTGIVSTAAAGNGNPVVLKLAPTT